MALQNSPLGRLAVELRLSIYESALKNKKDICQAHTYSRKGCRPRKGPKSFRDAFLERSTRLGIINLLLTCKVIATEASPIFYAINNFALPVAQLRSPWGLRARGDLAANIESLELTGYVHRQDAPCSHDPLSHDYLRLLKKWFPRLRAVSMEYDGWNVTKAIPLRPVAVGTCTANVMVRGATLKVSITCPSVQKAWANISQRTQQTSLRKNLNQLRRHWQRGGPWAYPTHVILTALWLALEAFDRGEQGHQDVLKWYGGPVYNVLLQHYHNPTSLTHTALRVANGSQSTAALAYLNGFLAMCSEHFHITSPGRGEEGVVPLWCLAMKNARKVRDSQDWSRCGYARI